MKRSATLPQVTLKQKASASPATLRRNNAPTAADCFGRKVSVCSAKPLHAQQTIMWMVVNMTCAKQEGCHDQQQAAVMLHTG